MPQRLTTHCKDCGTEFGDGVERAYKRGICKECFRIEDRLRYEAEYSNQHNVQLGGCKMLAVFSTADLERRNKEIARYTRCVEQETPIQYKAAYLDNRPET